MKPANHPHLAFLAIFTLTILTSHVSAHLDSGFDKTSGPYTFDIGWTPSAPNAGQSVLMAINVVNAGTEQAANVSSVWVRLDLKDDVKFAGTMTMEKGSTSFSYFFPKAGIRTITIQAGHEKITGDIWVPGEPPTGETWAWLVAAILALISGALAYQTWKNMGSKK